MQLLDVSQPAILFQILALVELFNAPSSRYARGEVYLLPKKIDEYVARWVTSGLSGVPYGTHSGRDMSRVTGTRVRRGIMYPTLPLPSSSSSVLFTMLNVMKSNFL